MQNKSTEATNLYMEIAGAGVDSEQVRLILNGQGFELRDVDFNRVNLRGSLCHT